MTDAKDIARDTLLRPLKIARALRRAGRMGERELLAICKATDDEMRRLGIEPNSIDNSNGNNRIT